MNANQKLFNRKTISIVIPCYNPADGWCKALLQNMTALNERLRWYSVQYIISNDGSTRLNPASVQSVSKFSNLMFLDHQQNEGKGAVIRKGTAHASGDIIIYTDIDFPFGLNSIVEIVDLFEKNSHCQFVYGNRVGGYFAKLPVKRRVISKLLHIFNWIFLSKEITDTQAGIKGFRSVLKKDVLATETNTFVFEIELMRRLIKQNVCIKSVDVTAIPTIVFSDFSMKVLFREVKSLSRILLRAGMISTTLRNNKEVKLEILYDQAKFNQSDV